MDSNIWSFKVGYNTIDYFRELISQDTIEVSNITLLASIDCMIKILEGTANTIYTNQLEQEANLLFQKFLLHSISVNELHKGTQFRGELTKMNLIDSISIWSLIRCQFEAFCAFNHIYISVSSEDEKLIKYNAWVISGLLFRQRLRATMPESKRKAETERLEVEKLKKQIEKNPYYQSLGTVIQQKLMSLINAKVWQFCFKNGKVEKTAWHEMAINTGLNGLIFEQSYNHLSLKSHPTNVSIFQLRDLFKDGENVNDALFALKFSSILNFAMLSDYCKYFPSVRQLFHGLPEIGQLLINFYNGAFRGQEHKIN